MTFENQKFISTWGALFFVFLVLLNYDYYPNFWWKEFLSAGFALTFSGWLAFNRQNRPTQFFFGWGAILFLLLFVTFSSFSVAMLGEKLGKSWLPLLVLLWIICTILLFRTWLHLPNGEMGNRRSIALAGPIGASMSALLLYLFSSYKLLDVIALMLNIIFSFAVACGLLVWLREYLKLIKN